MNKKGNKKFHFVTTDELNQMKEKAKEIQETAREKEMEVEEKVNEIKENIHEEVVEDRREEETKEFIIEEITDNEDEEVEEAKKEEGPYAEDLKKKTYFSFESRVVMMVGVTLVLFIMACLLITHILHRNKGEVVNYTESNQVSYQVCYIEDGCLAEDLDYVLDKTDNFKIKYKHSTNFSEEIAYDRTYYAKLLLRFYPSTDFDETIYQMEDILFQEKKNGVGKEVALDKELTINFDKYYRMIKKYKEDNEVSAFMEIVLYSSEGTDVRKLASLSIPFEEIYRMTKSIIPSTEGEMRVDKNFWDTYTVICTIMFSLLLGSSLYLLYKTTNYIISTTSAHNEYQRKLLKILREYDRIIVIARGGYESNFVKEVRKVNTFEELLEIKKTLQKPIIYSRVNDVKSDFIVEDDNIIYKYVFKEADM